MKRLVKLLVCLIIVPCLICLTGCSVVKVEGKSFVFKNCSVNYVGSGSLNGSVLSLEQDKLTESFKNFELAFSKDKQINLLEDKQIYYFQDGKKICLFSNPECTNNYFGEDDCNLKLRAYEDMVVLTFCGGSGQWLSGYNYTVAFTQKQVN